MDPSLYQAAARIAPGEGRAAQLAQLYALAVSPGSPQALAARLRNGLALVAALLLACGLIFWIAANWQAQTRMFKLGLIEGALALSVLAALLWPRVRTAALLCATLVLGGVLAFIGQTYQTGADAWQLFAVWAALALVWVGLARSDVLWTLWVLIAALGIALWAGRFDIWNVLFVEHESLPQLVIRMGLWLAPALVPALVACVPWLRVKGDVAWWSHRVALGCALAAWAGIGIVHLFDFAGRQSGAALVLSALLIGGSIWVSMQGRLQDFVALCLAVLAANVWVLSAVARALFHGNDFEAMLLFFSLLTLACLGGSVRGLMAVQRRMRAPSAPSTAAKEVV